MMRLLFTIEWLNLKRDRVSLIFVFLLPLAFFSLYALIFGRLGAGAGALKPLNVIIVDQDQTDISRGFVTALSSQPGIRMLSESQRAETRQTASTTQLDSVMEHIRAGDDAVAVLIPPGFGGRFSAFRRDGTPLEVLYNAANPSARYIMGGLLQSTALTTAPSLLLQHGTAFLDAWRQTLPPVERPPIEALLLSLRAEKPWEHFGIAAPTPASQARHPSGTAWVDNALQYAELLQLPVKTTDVRGAEGDLISYYAAGIGVMFLLFSMAGAGGSLLEEQETGTLERLLNSDLKIGTLLLGKWSFFTAIAILQLLAMFVWGALVFGLQLWTVNHLVGLLVMALVTATAAAAFGIVFATLCTTRAQLSGISTIVILLMSALGGSMAPRFVMPAFMTTVAKFTFNGWALDGFLKVFWYDNPNASLRQSLLALWPQVAVLAGLTLVLLTLAYVLARRWETV